MKCISEKLYDGWKEFLFEQANLPDEANQTKLNQGQDYHPQFCDPKLWVQVYPKFMLRQENLCFNNTIEEKRKAEFLYPIIQNFFQINLTNIYHTLKKHLFSEKQQQRFKKLLNINNNIRLKQFTQALLDYVKSRPLYFYFKNFGGIAAYHLGTGFILINFWQSILHYYNAYLMEKDSALISLMTDKLKYSLIHEYWHAVDNHIRKIIPSYGNIKAEDQVSYLPDIYNTLKLQSSLDQHIENVKSIIKSKGFFRSLYVHNTSEIYTRLKIIQELIEKYKANSSSDIITKNDLINFINREFPHNADIRLDYGDAYTFLVEELDLSKEENIQIILNALNSLAKNDNPQTQRQNA